MAKAERGSWKDRMVKNPSPPPSPVPMVEDFPEDKKFASSVKEERKFKFHVPSGCLPAPTVPDIDQGDEYCKWDPNVDAYFCSICDSTMNSDHTYLMHLGGKRHQKKLATVQLTTNVKLDVPRNANMQEIRVGGEHKILATKELNQVPKIQQAIDKEQQPVIGLNYVTEILRLDKKQDPVYHCSLCPADCQLSSIIGHVTGLKHRMAFMKLNYPDIYAAVNNTSEKRSSLSDRAEYHAVRIERDHGRGSMIVEEEMDPVEGGGEDETDDVPLTEEEVQYTKESVKKWPKKDQIDFLHFALNNIFETELAKPGSLNAKQLATLKESSDNIKANLMKETLKSLNEETYKRINDGISVGDTSYAEEVLPFPANQIGQPVREVLNKLIQKGEFSFNDTFKQ